MVRYFSPFDEGLVRFKSLLGVPLALALSSCNPAATHPAATPVSDVQHRQTSRSTVIARELPYFGTPTPTMSPDVTRMASGCSGHRIGEMIEPGRRVSAKYADGLWVVEIEGLWSFHPPFSQAPEGYPTTEPWRELNFMTSCELTIDAETAYVSGVSGVVVTATPPGGVP